MPKIKDIPEFEPEDDMTDFTHDDPAPADDQEKEPREFEWVKEITSLDMPELVDYPKKSELVDESESPVFYRRVPTSIGPVPAHVGNYLAKSASGIHVLRSDPRGDGE